MIRLSCKSLILKVCINFPLCKNTTFYVWKLFLLVKEYPELQAVGTCYSAMYSFIITVVIQAEKQLTGTLFWNIFRKTSWTADRLVFVEAEESTGIGVAVEGEALEAESAVIMKPNGAENWVGPASRRRDNIGAPAMQAFMHTHYHTKEQSADRAAEAFRYRNKLLRLLEKELHMYIQCGKFSFAPLLTL